MADRRRGARYRLAEPGMGSFRIVQDVEILHVDEASAVVTGGNIPSGERLLLHIPLERDDASCTRLALAVEQFVRIEDDGLRREVRLKILPRDNEPESLDPALSASMAARRLIGAVIRRVPVRMTEVSLSGCLWETPVPLDAGSVGFVEMQSAHGRRSEAVRVMHSSRLPGAVWQYQAAAEFLTLGPPSLESLRGVATIIAARRP
jgi:hypothetical protein